MTVDPFVVHVARLRRVTGTRWHEVRRGVLDPEHLIVARSTADSVVPEGAEATCDVTLQSFDGGGSVDATNGPGMSGQAQDDHGTPRHARRARDPGEPGHDPGDACRVRHGQPGADPLQAILGGLDGVGLGMQRAAEQFGKVRVGLVHAWLSSTVRIADMARAVWLLTAPVLIPMTEAICPTGRSA